MQDFKFKLMGMTWQVKGIEEDNVFGDGHHGLCNPRETTIYYHKADSKPQQQNTLIHESLHAIEKTLDREFDEQDICGLAAGIHELIQDPVWLKAAKGK